MPVTDARVDAYIARQRDFARPVLAHIRAIVHAACPDAVEAIKWGQPFFVHRDTNLCHMGAFKAHVAFGFWYGDDVTGAQDAPGGMGQFGRITTVDDLPDAAALSGLVAKAAALIDAGAKPGWRTRDAPRTPLPVPPALLAAIAASPAAASVWAGFTPGKVRDYAEWIGEAKRPETRDKRIAQAVGWIAEGKARNWKYR